MPGGSMMYNMKMVRTSSPRERGGPYLTVVIGHTEVQRRPFHNELVIGRALECDLCLPDPMMSRQHCKLEPAVEGDGWAVVDLNSRNGVFVNAKRVMQRQALNHGDVITVGKAHITFHAHGYQPPRPADPHAAAQMPPERITITRRDPATSKPRELPTPKISNADTMMPPANGTEAKPLPFTRPPARPIVKESPDDE
jgi:pSer/pThr/pTyr-binding forkhead associated (FHA) protein